MIERIFWCLILIVSIALSGVILQQMFADWSANPGNSSIKFLIDKFSFPDFKIFIDFQDIGKQNITPICLLKHA
jgi:hypothetical protein